MKIDRIMPFLWLKKENKDELEKELKAMLEMGITSFVVESRIHAGFCEETWFEEMDYIMGFAHSNGMKVWLLDDKSYPTGYANGVLFAKGKTRQSRRVKALRTDLSGKRSDIKVRIDINEDFDEKILGIYLAKRGESFSRLLDPVDVTDQLHGDYVYLDLEEGHYSLVSVVETSAHYEREGYIDMLDPASIKELIDAVYEPHYARYKEYFGNTFCGFFSDEPRFNCSVYLNGAVSSFYEGKIGKYGMAYPWSADIREKIGKDSSILSLWFDMGEETADIRCRYMELVTDCYAENFVGQLSKWCRERGVLYTGHIIEDMDAHTSLMCSAGHYFKSMKGADIASVDVVLHQIASMENDGGHFVNITDIVSGYSDSTFFNHTLMKLASSCAHIDENKHGRALCEIFGAYGWGESMSEMIYLANHALVRGINYFIPHAFTSEFDNKDCPPHFYAGGLNPSNGSYRLLFDYMNTVSGLFSEGKALIDVAVLYHAQTEWSGGDFDPCDVIAKQLMQNQIDFDFVDFAALSKGVQQDKEIVVGDNRYKLLIVPYFEKLPRRYKTILESFRENVIYATKAEKDIGDTVKERLGYSYKSIENLRVLRYKKGRDYYVMFLNEGDNVTLFSPNDYCHGFDCGTYANDYVSGTYLPVIDEAISIKPRQALICENAKQGLNDFEYKTRSITPPSDIYLKSYDGIDYKFYKHVENPFFNINRYDECPNFSGFVKVKAHMDWKRVSYIKVVYDAEFCDLYIGNNVYKSIGGQLSCDLSGVNCLEEEVYFVLGSGLGNVLNDDFSQCSYISPCKLISISVYNDLK